jgi:hypothetical protein
MSGCAPEADRRQWQLSGIRKRMIQLLAASVTLEIIRANRLAEIPPLPAGSEVFHQAQIAQQTLETRISAQAVLAQDPDNADIRAILYDVVLVQRVQCRVQCHGSVARCRKSIYLDVVAGQPLAPLIFRLIILHAIGHAETYLQ